MYFSLFKGETAERSVSVVKPETRPLQITRVEPAEKCVRSDADTC